MAKKHGKHDIEIRTASGVVCRIPNTQENDSERLDEAASRWNNVVLNRQRWNQYQPMSDAQKIQCHKQLLELGVTSKQLKKLAKQPVVEIRIPFETERIGWSARIMPWEYLISSAVSHEVGNNANPTTVIRHLDRGRRPSRKPRETTAAIVLCAPDTIFEKFDFGTELQLIGSRLEIKPQVVDNPNEKTLKNFIESDHPDVIHFAGCDSRQATQILEESEVGLLDGIALLNNDGDKFLTSEQIARLLRDSDGRCPYLAVFNIFNSASRTAALSVAEGVSVAIGFQDTIDDFAAELFLSEFYRAWYLTGGKPLESFLVGCETLASMDVTKCGSGIVLWSERSLIRESANADLAAKAIVKDVNSRRSREIGFESRLQAKKSLGVHYRVKKNLNYSLLHNGQPLFDFFTLGKKDLRQEGEISDVRVEIEMLGGGEPLTCCIVQNVTDSGVDLADQLFVPLTSNLTRTIDSAIDTALHVKVSVGDFEGVIEKTERVRLLPVREWVDDEQNWYFLPSFVFPNDPDVQRVINAAIPHLRAISRDPLAGFDGYQSIDKKLADPYENVHNQIAAIWSALIEMSITYINPPPTYTARSQRIRIPSDVIGSTTGTCIDLALLLASCFEYIEIYPVMFLLEGHAFVGYWRSEEDWEQFMCMKEDEMYGWVEAGSRTKPSKAWVFDETDFNLVYAVIHQGKLVPLEATGLTDRSGFDDARDEGWDNFYNPAEFHSLIDVTTARQVSQPVTPVPLGAFE